MRGGHRNTDNGNWASPCGENGHRLQQASQIGHKNFVLIWGRDLPPGKLLWNAPRKKEERGENERDHNKGDNICLRKNTNPIHIKSSPDNDGSSQTKDGGRRLHRSWWHTSYVQNMHRGEKRERGESMQMPRKI